MELSRSLLPEFDHEMANTRKVLDRVPQDKADFRPHPRSMTLARLAGHLAELPGFAARAMTTESLDLAPADGPPREPYVMTSRKELLDRFDKGVAGARSAIAAASDEELARPWTLLAGGRTVFTLPRRVALRSFILSHSIHHRAQLGVYLRMNDVPVPSLYGPSADEGAF